MSIINYKSKKYLSTSDKKLIIVIIIEFIYFLFKNSKNLNNVYNTTLVT